MIQIPLLVLIFFQFPLLPKKKKVRSTLPAIGSEEMTIVASSHRDNVNRFIGKEVSLFRKCPSLQGDRTSCHFLFKGSCFATAARRCFIRHYEATGRTLFLNEACNTRVVCRKTRARKRCHQPRRARKPQRITRIHGWNRKASSCSSSVGHDRRRISFAR